MPSVATAVRRLETMRMIELARAGNYEGALDTYSFDDLWTYLAVFGYKALSLKVKLEKLFQISHNSNFTKLYLLYNNYKNDFSGIFVKERARDKSKNHAIMDTLYIDKKFPREYNRLMTHEYMKKVFTDLDNKIRGIFIYHYRNNGNIDKRKKFEYKFDDKNFLFEADLTTNASYDFGETFLRVSIVGQKIAQMPNGKLKIQYFYDVCLYDYFEDPVNLKIDMGHTYIMRTKPIPKKGCFIINVKGDIVEKDCKNG